MRTRDDMVAFDRERQAAARTPGLAPSSTLVVRCQVIDYSKGNRFLQLWFIDFGNAVLTLRCSYFDKASGDELGRSVISSDNSSKVIPSALMSRTALTGVINGLVDQVTRRNAEWRVLMAGLRSVGWSLLGAAIAVRLAALFVSALRWQFCSRPSATCAWG